VNASGSILELAQRAFARTGATRIYVVSLPAAIAAGADVQAAASPLNFQESGVVVAIQGQERTGTAAKFASTEVRIQMGNEDLATDGQAGAFVPMLMLFSPGQPYFAMNRRVQVGVPWTVTFRNRDAGAAANPTLSLAFIADADVRRQSRG
jgi:hypothetical protein